MKIEKQVNTVGLDSKILNDENLSFISIGLYAYMMSKDEINITELSNRSNTEGKTKILSSIDELIKSGYIEFKDDTYYLNPTHTTDVVLYKPKKNNKSILPKTDTALTVFLKKENPEEYIDDITTEEDLATLKRLYEDKHWEYNYSLALWQWGKKYSWLTVPQFQKKKYVLQTWADDFNKIVRTKKGDEIDTKLIMKWLTKNDWWIPRGNFRSPAKFHKQCRHDGVSNWFEWFLREVNKEIPKQPTPGYSYTKKQVDDIVYWYNEKKTSFSKTPNEMYMYRPK